MCARRRVVLLLLSLGCGDDAAPMTDGPPPADAAPPDAPSVIPSLGVDITDTALALDLAAMTGVATITMVRPPDGRGSFEVGDLDVQAVEEPDGTAVNHGAADGRLDVMLPAGDPVTIVVRYAFQSHTEFDGWDAGGGLSFLWPYFCGNLYPCHSSPADGVRFTLDVTGAGAGVVVYPTSIPAEAPSYMPAVAVGSYTELALTPTSAGTALSVWYLPGQAADAAAGTAHLSQVFDFYERTYGAYAFGPKAGTVSAAWGPGAYGGMEHHPFWHVASGALSSEEVNAHEAAHGWFGNGVRMRCWEDFVLSEGTVTYLAARALGEFGVDVWPSYRAQLDGFCPGAGNTIAWPAGCNDIDILSHPVWSGVPYYKGAYFFRAVAERIGEDVLDQAIGAFYTASVGRASGMQDLVDAIEAQGGMSLDDLVNAWLRVQECPPY